MEVTSDLLAPVTKCTTCYPDFHTRPPNFKQLLNISEFVFSGSASSEFSILAILKVLSIYFLDY